MGMLLSLRCHRNPFRRRVVNGKESEIEFTEWKRRIPWSLKWQNVKWFDMLTSRVLNSSLQSFVRHLSCSWGRQDPRRCSRSASSVRRSYTKSREFLALLIGLKKYGWDGKTNKWAGDVLGRGQTSGIHKKQQFCRMINEIFTFLFCFQQGKGREKAASHDNFSQQTKGRRKPFVSQTCFGDTILMTWCDDLDCNQTMAAINSAMEWGRCKLMMLFTNCLLKHGGLTLR